LRPTSPRPTARGAWTLDGFDEKILALHVGGVATRETEFN